MYREEGVEAIMASSSEFEEAWAVKGLDRLRPWDDRFWKLYDRGDVSVHQSSKVQATGFSDDDADPLARSGLNPEVRVCPSPPSPPVPPLSSFLAPV